MVIIVDIKKYDKEFTEVLSIYGIDIETISDEKADEILADIQYSKEQYGIIDYSEYFKYDFIHKSPEERSTFCGSKDYGEWCRNSILCEEDKPWSNNKYKTYLRAKDYYKRDLIQVASFDDYACFSEFLSKHKKYLVKPIEGSRGLGISKVVVSEHDSVKALFFQALQYGGCVCEEWIEQSKEMAEFNETSVNTIRITTVFENDRLEKIYGMFRTGVEGMPVDNASMGGIACGIDLETGIIFSDGYTKKNVTYINHPTSGKKFKGFQIPKWNDAILLITKLHKLFPEFVIMGWDLALTDFGWVLVENNSKPSIDTIQLIYNRTYGYGLKKTLEQTIGKYK